MGDYMWGLRRESNLQHVRKTRKPTHFWTIWNDFWLSLSIYHASIAFYQTHEAMNGNMKLFMFWSNKCKIFLGCAHKMKVCAECNCFSIGFRHKTLKYNTQKPETKIVLHSVIKDPDSRGNIVCLPTAVHQNIAHIQCRHHDYMMYTQNDVVCTSMHLSIYWDSITLATHHSNHQRKVFQSRKLSCTVYKMTDGRKLFRLFLY